MRRRTSGVTAFQATMRKYGFAGLVDDPSAKDGYIDAAMTVYALQHTKAPYTSAKTDQDAFGDERIHG